MQRARFVKLAGSAIGKGFVGALLLVAVSASARAGSFDHKLTQVGDWTVFVNADPMTDKVDCIATYKGSSNHVQLTADSFAIGYSGRGGVSSYVIRFDDEPASDTKLATEIEKKISALLFKGSDFYKFTTSKRVRVQAFSVLSTVNNDDVNLTGVSDVTKVLTGPKCTGTAKN